MWQLAGYILYLLPLLIVSYYIHPDFISPNCAYELQWS